MEVLVVMPHRVTWKRLGRQALGAQPGPDRPQEA